jgi:predicted nucleotidyltransferase
MINMSIVDGEIQRIRRIVESIVSRRGGFEKIYLFGSRARGDDREKSDYDFCVYPDDDVSLLKLVGLMNDLSEELKSEVDIVDATALKAGDVFISEIERDGVLVYER